MSRPRLILALILLAWCGLLADFVWSVVVLHAAVHEAQVAANAAGRVLAHAPPRPGDPRVSIDPAGPAQPSLGTMWGFGFKRAVTSYRPWRGLRAESFIFRVCSNPGNYIAQLTRLDTHWTARFTDGVPGACGPSS